MTADRDRLAAAVDPLPLAYMSPGAVAAVLLPVVQALVAEGAAAELRAAADNVRKQAPGYIGRIDTADSIDDRAAALDPS